MESKTITFGTVLLFFAWLLAQVFFTPPAVQDPSIGVPVARICLGLFLTGSTIIIVRQIIGFKNKQKKASQRISNIYLKTYGNKILVDLSLCEILEETDCVVIRHSSEFKGQIKLYSTTIHNNIKNVKQKLNNMRNTFLYIDSKDANKYYLDLEFLEEK